ncbi:hypothetical protein PHJA_002949500 [Phtheirospermum japonicum]|uniref:Uncharacterized protein n=1 Tax=Phtheirospermum japonicum TaxID=374723 RepID=A0A830DIY4_9LAMI|nr:hypothetical protein PHJA_002949500 [Phtheirospermum japonicum]
MDIDQEEIEVVVIIEEVMNMIRTFLLLVHFYVTHFLDPLARRRRTHRLFVHYRMADRIPDQISNMRTLTSIDHMTRSETEETSTGQEAESSATGKDRKGKKRKAVDPLQERFVALMESFVAKTDGRLGELAQRIGFQQDVKLQRKAVFDALSAMHFLSVEDKLTVSKMLCKSGEDLDLFDSISDEYKMVMVKMMLDGRL